MYKHCVLFVVALLGCAQCKPLDLTTHKESSSSSQLHLFMDNSTQSNNYHLSPFKEAMEDIDDEIDKQLQAVLPFLNFFFDTLLSPSSSGDDEDDDCKNSMVIQLVPEGAPPPKKADVKPQSTPKSVDNNKPNTDVEPADQPNTEVKPVTDAKPETKPSTEVTPVIKPSTEVTPESKPSIDKPDEKAITEAKSEAVSKAISETKTEEVLTNSKPAPVDNKKTTS